MSSSDRRWSEVAPGVWVCRHRDLDLTTGFVLGTDAGLVVDTGADLVAGAGLRADLAALPGVGPDVALSVVYTHAHHDHCFGTAALTSATSRDAASTAATPRGAAAADRPGSPARPVPVWAHERCAVELAVNGLRRRGEVVAEYRGTGRDRAAERIAAVTPVVPTRTLSTSAAIELGGRDVQLLHLGRGHTDHDVVVLVPDADVVFAGDLVEHGAPPAFEDSHPAAWPTTLTRLLELLGPTAAATTVVPGHGDPVDTGFVAGQRDELAAVAAACVGGRLDGGPYPPAVMAQAIEAFRRG